MTTTSERNLRILLANESEDELRALGDVLEGLGHEVVPFAVSVAEATELIAREDPDVAFVVFDGDDQHGLALISETVTFASGPVLVTVREAESGTTVARRRYREEARLNEKVEQLESALERRAIIERAKGVMMERHSVDERRAFELLRDHARSGGRRVVDVAQTVLDGHPLLPPKS